MSLSQLHGEFAETLDEGVKPQKTELVRVANQYFDDSPDEIYNAIISAFAESYHQVCYFVECERGFDAAERELSQLGLNGVEIVRTGINHSRGWRSCLAAWSVEVEYLSGAADLASPVQTQELKVPVLLTGKGRKLAIRVLTVRNLDWVPIIGQNVVRTLGAVSQDDAAEAIIDAARLAGTPFDSEINYTPRAQDFINREEVDTFLAKVEEAGNEWKWAVTYAGYGATAGASGRTRRHRLPMREDLPRAFGKALATERLYKATIKTKSDILGLTEGTTLSLHPAEGILAVATMLKGGQFHEFLEHVMG